MIRQGLLWLTALLGLSGCAEVLPFAPPTLVPLPARSAEAVAACDWSRGADLLLVRQTVLFDLGGRRVALNGVLRLDRSAGSARLVALDDFGVKLFDLSVTAAGFEEHFLMPELARQPGLAAAVAASVRRIWLEPRPRGDEHLAVEGLRYRLWRASGSDRIEFLFGGEPPQLLEKRQFGEDGAGWRVRYFEFQAADGLVWPRGIVLDDERYRLTVWVESVRRTR